MKGIYTFEYAILHFAKIVKISWDYTIIIHNLTAQLKIQKQKLSNYTRGVDYGNFHSSVKQSPARSENWHNLRHECNLIIAIEETWTRKPDEESSKEMNPKKKVDVQTLWKKVPNVTNVRPSRASLHEVVTWESGGHLTLVLSRVHLVSGFRYAAKRSCSPTTLLQRQPPTLVERNQEGRPMKRTRARKTVHNNRFLNPFVVLVSRRSNISGKSDTFIWYIDKRANQSTIL